MKEHRCEKCHKLLFKYDDQVDIVYGEVVIETQHNCKDDNNQKVKNVKSFN